jgi:cyclic pyranopterin phosphate synthase
MSQKNLSHINTRGEAHMVDVGEKNITSRTAIASGTIKTLPETFRLVVDGKAKKGDVLATARIAGIMAAKKTSDLIPLCHPLALTKVTLDIEPDIDLPGFKVTATASVFAKTGVEMEALTAVSTACLTLYDMLKAVDRGMVISQIRLLEKHGGKSGSFKAEL